MENCNELQKQISFTKLKGVCETIFNLQRKVKHLTGNELYQITDDFAEGLTITDINKYIISLICDILVDDDLLSSLFITNEHISYLYMNYDTTLANMNSATDLEEYLGAEDEDLESKYGIKTFEE